MKITVGGLVLIFYIFLSPSFACEAGGVMEGEVPKIVYEKLQEFAPKKNVDISRLPRPIISSQANRLIYDFKDIAQNAWIVIIVHPDGFAEVSFTRITE